MRASFFILGCFILGLLLAASGIVPQQILEIEFARYLLPTMMFLVGISIGGDIKSLYKPIRDYRLRILLVPLSTLIGTTLATLLLGFILADCMTLREVVAVGSGYGYYSLSAIYLKEMAGEEMGVMALVSNISRELFTILFAPVLVSFWGRLAPITAAGSTSIDVSLPIIARYSGESFVVISIFHGMVIDFCVPLIITLLYG